jgi:fatty acid desaturase
VSTERIPSRLNAVLLAATSLVSGGALWLASHVAQGWVVLLAALVFSYAANALFALLHEAVHGVLFENASANTWGGRLASAWFPTGLALQRAFHLNHHQHNRDPSERFDYLQPGESRWLYWGFAALGGLAWLVAPFAFALGRGSSRFSKQTASATYFEAIQKIPPFVSRLEVLASWAFQIVLFMALDLSVVGWLACYAAFAWQWSALQYADHAWSPLDATEGAWDLRVPTVHRWLFLNYHLHRAHHRSPRTPWLHLPARAAGDGPSFWSVYLSMWRGPRVLP